MSNRLVFLIRHAHRNTQNRRLDNGLSAKGWEQEALIQRQLMEKLKTQDSIHFFTSPKQRCVETLQGLALVSNQNLKIDPQFDEQGPNETDLQFSERVKRATDFIKSLSPSTVLVCSHGDVIPLLIEFFTGLSCDLTKGGWIELEETADEWTVKDASQTSKRQV